METRVAAEMLNEWSDTTPEPPLPCDRSAMEYLFLAVVGVLGALFVVSAIVGLFLVKVAIKFSCAPTDKGRAMRCVSAGGGDYNRTAAWCVSPKGGDLSCAMMDGGFALRWERFWRDHRCQTR